MDNDGFGFHATSFTGPLTVIVRMQRPVDISHSLTLQSCDPAKQVVDIVMTEHRHKHESRANNGSTSVLVFTR